MSVKQATKDIEKAQKKIADSTKAIDDGKPDRAKNRNAEADAKLVNALAELEEEEEPDEPDEPAVGEDEIDPATITFLHADVSAWAITSETTDVDASDPGQMCIEHTKAGQWPANADGIEGNPWVVAFINGWWWAATYEWLRSGQICKAMNVPEHHSDIAHSLGPHTKKAPIESWVPVLGETVGFFVSTLARDPQRNGDERSNIVLIDWPY